MAKLEYSPITDFQRLNFIGKRMFDFMNSKINITTGVYAGTGSTSKEILVDIIPKVIIVFPQNDGEMPIIWLDVFSLLISKELDGSDITNGILGLIDTKQGFMVGAGLNVLNDNYYYAVLGS